MAVRPALTSRDPIRWSDCHRWNYGVMPVDVTLDECECDTHCTRQGYRTSQNDDDINIFSAAPDNNITFSLQKEINLKPLPGTFLVKFDEFNKRCRCYFS